MTQNARNQLTAIIEDFGSFFSRERLDSSSRSIRPVFGDESTWYAKLLFRRTLRVECRYKRDLTFARVKWYENNDIYSIQLLHPIVCRIVHITGRLLLFSLRCRLSEVVGARKNERARGRHACLPLASPFFLGPPTQASCYFDTRKLPLKTIIS